jgi:endonuclease YncB( thermonuclease family)
MVNAVAIDCEHRMRRLLVAILLIDLGLVASASCAELAGSARLIDGDTIEVGGQIVRLHGIDAPETGQTCTDAAGAEWLCGEEAGAALGRLIAGQSVTCEGDVRDAYGRLIAVCRTPQGELNRRMVLDGMAVPFTRFSDDYLAEGIDARKAGRGLHAGPFRLPEEFRAAAWQSGTPDCPADCPIKGNISDRGRIYHVPWSRHYGRTRIDAARGERCFCTEAEALGAGWRAPYR